MLLIIVGAQFMLVLDTNIMNVALPTMGRYFGESQTSMTWTINSYTLAFGGFLLLGGRIGDLIGRRQALAIGLGLFSIGGLLGGLAVTFPMLLVGRVIQGLGGALAAPAALSLLSTSFTEEVERRKAFVVYSAVSGAGAATGVLLGGVLTQYVSWRWVLLVNVPIGIAIVIGSYLYLHQSERHRGRVDVAGALLSVIGMVALVYGFIHAADSSWSNGTTITALSVAVVSLVAFVWWQTRAADPMLPMRVILDRNRGGSYLVMLIAGAGIYSMVYFVTYFEQQVMHFDAIKTGFSFLPISLIIVSASQAMTKLVPRYGPKPLVSIGTLLLAAGLLFWHFRITADSGYWDSIFPGLVIASLGVGFIFVPMTITAVARVQVTDAGIASATLNVGQQIGGSIGLAVLATAAATAGSSATSSRIAALSSGVSAGHLSASVIPHVRSLIASQSGSIPSSAALHDATALHAVAQIHAQSTSAGFLVGGIFALVAVVVARVAINVKRPSRMPDEAIEPPSVGSSPIVALRERDDELGTNASQVRRADN